MTFLPLIERELRVRSRQRGFYWWRFAVAVIGSVFVLPLLTSPVEPRGPVPMGAYVFNTMVGLLFILCSCAGVLTASAITREREEGTLGFLFLTNVNSFDVIIGALGSAAITCLCVLVAYIPVIAVPILAGGVSGGEAFRKSLVLVVTLCLALVLGLWTSSRGQQRTNYTWLPAVAMALFIAVTVPIGPAGALWFSTDSEYKRAPHHYWQAVAATCVFAAVFLRYAIVSLRKSLSRPIEQRVAVDTIESAVVPRVADGVNAIEWLVQRQKPLKIAFWSAAILAASWSGGLRFVYPFLRFLWSSGNGFAYSWWGFTLAIGVIKASLIAWAASRFIFESRRNGALELIMTTPIGAHGILPPYWAALKRMVKWPIIVMSAPALFWLVASMFSPFGGPPGWRGYMIYQVGLGLTTPLTIVVSTLALLWCGMRFAFTARSQAAAVLYAVALVQGIEFLLPQLWRALAGQAFGSFAVLAGSSSSGPGTMFWIMQLAPHVLVVAALFTLYSRARRRALASNRPV